MAAPGYGHMAGRSLSCRSVEILELGVTGYNPRLAGKWPLEHGVDYYSFIKSTVQPLSLPLYAGTRLTSAQYLGN